MLSGLFGCLFVCLVGWLVGWLCVCLFVGWLVWLVGWFGWLVGCLFVWFGKQGKPVSSSSSSSSSSSFFWGVLHCLALIFSNFQNPNPQLLVVTGSVLNKGGDLQSWGFLS